jgi:hypothetical protein
MPDRGADVDVGFPPERSAPASLFHPLHLAALSSVAGRTRLTPSSALRDAA